jgi:hypothetical protein
VPIHICWGNYEGPHVCDIDTGKVFPVLMAAKARYVPFETSNPVTAMNGLYSAAARHRFYMIKSLFRASSIPPRTLLNTLISWRSDLNGSRLCRA